MYDCGMGKCERGDQIHLFHIKCIKNEIKNKENPKWMLN